MTPISTLGLLAMLLFPSTSAAQGRVGTLAQTNETFNAADANRDGRLGPEELVALEPQLTRSDFRGVDFDQDGFWSKGEFLLFHRQRLLAAKVKPAADLEAEATRILAARKAKAIERNTQRSLSGAWRAGQQAPLPGAAVATRPGVQTPPGDKGAKNDPKPTPQPAPRSRPKPGGQEPEKPQPPSDQPPHGPAPKSSDAKPARGPRGG